MHNEVLLSEIQSSFKYVHTKRVLINVNSTSQPLPPGRPFHWAQRLAGITSWSPESALDVATCRATVPPFLEAIKQRCLARLALKYQLR